MSKGTFMNNGAFMSNGAFMNNGTFMNINNIFIYKSRNIFYNIESDIELILKVIL